MHAYKFVATIPPDHQLLLPEEIPAGRAEIHVIMDAGGSDNGSLLALVDELAKTGGVTRTKEDIDRELARERESWE